MHSTFFRKFGPLIIFLTVLFGGSVGLYFGSDTLFAIRNIEVIGDPVNVVVNDEKLPKNLLFFPAAKLKGELLRDNPLLLTLELKKKFLHTLVIVAERRIPVAKININSMLGLIDTEGYIVGLDDGTTSLPLISFDPIDASVGQKIDDPATRAALSLIASLPPEYIFEKITKYDRLSVIAKLAKTDIIVAQQTDQSSLSATLQTILNGFRIKGTMPTRIDLRFDKPVITF